jgi:hypothetical protein
VIGNYSPGHASRIADYGSARFLHYLNHSPTLSRRQRASLHYSHDVANVRAHLVVRHELRPSPNVPFVFPVPNLSFNANNYRLLHLVTGDQTYLFLSAVPGRRARISTRD